MTVAVAAREQIVGRAAQATKRHRPCAYAPELNPVEHIWDELREKHFHNLVLDSLDALEDHLEVSLRTLEQAPATIMSIVTWPRIISALLN